MNKKLLLTTKDVSELLSIGKSTVYAYVQAGVLKAVCLPPTRESNAVKNNRTCIRFKVEDVHEFLDNLGGWSLSSSKKGVPNGSH